MYNLDTWPYRQRYVIIHTLTMIQINFNIFIGTEKHLYFLLQFVKKVFVIHQLHDTTPLSFLSNEYKDGEKKNNKNTHQPIHIQTKAL